MSGELFQGNFLLLVKLKVLRTPKRSWVLGNHDTNMLIPTLKT